MPNQFRSFKEFYPYYLGHHTKTLTRSMHAGGLILGYLVGILAVASYVANGNPRLLLVLALGPVIAYTISWASHFFVEGNAPATFERPLWSLMGDHKMMLSSWIAAFRAAIGR